MDLIFSVDKMPFPGQTILSTHYDMASGGKGANQAVAAKRALKDPNIAVKFQGCVGKDAFGSVLKDSFLQDDIDISDLKEISCSTGCASIWLDKNGENSIVVAPGANSFVKANDVKGFSLDTFLLLQMEIPFEENWPLINRAYQKGATVFLNLAPAFPISKDILKKITYLILNEQEALDLLDIFQLPRSNNFQENSATLSCFSGQTSIITRGAKGYVAATPTHVWQGEALKITPIDTTGAGDTFIGALAAALKSSMPFEEALRFSATASSLACLKKGAQISIPSYAEIEKHLHLVPLPQKKALT